MRYASGVRTAARNAPSMRSRSADMSGNSSNGEVTFTTSGYAYGIAMFGTVHPSRTVARWADVTDELVTCVLHSAASREHVILSR